MNEMKGEMTALDIEICWLGNHPPNQAHAKVLVGLVTSTGHMIKNVQKLDVTTRFRLQRLSRSISGPRCDTQRLVPVVSSLCHNAVRDLGT